MWLLYEQGNGIMHKNLVYQKELTISNSLLIKWTLTGDEARNMERVRSQVKLDRLKEFRFYPECNGTLKVFTKPVTRFS